MGIRDSFGAAGKGSFSKFKMHNFDSKQKESTLGPFRLLPPMGKLQKDPRGWRMYHRVHYGYKGVAFGTDKTKTKNRPFACIEESDFKTKMITRSCPECRLIEQKERQLQDIKDDIKAELKSLGVLDDKQLERMVDDKAKLHEKGKPLFEWLDAHNCDGKYYVNLVDAEYTPGLVKLAKRHVEAIEEAVDKLAKLGIAALNDFDQGAWFTLTRKGSGNETKHLADWLQEPIPNVPGAAKPKLAPLSDEVLERCMTDCPDLSVPPMCSILSAEQIVLLTECSGDPDEVDAIYKMTERTPGSTQDAKAAAPQESKAPPPATSKLPPASTAAAGPGAAPAATVVDPRYAQLKAMGFTEAQIEAAIGKPKPPPPPVDPRIAGLKAMGMSQSQIEAILAMPASPAPALTQAEEKAISSLENGNTTTQLPAGHDLISLAKKAEQVKAKTEAERVAAEPSSMDPGLDPDMDPAKFAADFALPPR